MGVYFNQENKGVGAFREDRDPCLYISKQVWDLTDFEPSGNS